MAHSLSAKKRVRQNIKHRARNRWRKQSFRDMIAEYRDTLVHGTAEQAKEKLQAIYKTLDQVAAKGTIHRKTASRYKSRLTARLNDKQKAPAAA
ncbi:MAG: 30S ribosomal protein S20 [Phycisphaeraceae bacterium]|nr:30S ribosomal protein S20 [Phycisphaeraceae bacterium]